MEKLFFLVFFAASFMLQANDTEKKFTEIYDNAIWGRNAEGIGYSGGGSDVHNAQSYMDFLQKFLKAYNVSSVVDVGCGDWTFSRYLNWEGVDYLGYDVVKSVIEKNLVNFSSSSIDFIHGNAVHMDLPEADLLICKDVLQHLSNEEIFLFLNQVHKYKYCLITNDIDPNTMSGSNTAISDGEYRTLDLTAPPFNVIGLSVYTYPSGGNLKQVLMLIN